MNYTMNYTILPFDIMEKILRMGSTDSYRRFCTYKLVYKGALSDTLFDFYDDERLRLNQNQIRLNQNQIRLNQIQLEMNQYIMEAEASYEHLRNLRIEIELLFK